jgi:hypothetical protein
MINKRTLLLAAVLATPALSAHARAQSAAQVYIGKGTNVGGFITFGPTVTCQDGTQGSAFGYGDVGASDSLTPQQGSRATMNNGMYIDIWYYADSCGNFVFGSGGLPNAYTPVDHNLNSAGIAGSGFVQDYSSGATVPFSIDLVFAGQGAAYSSNGTFVSHDQYGDTVQVVRGASSSRSAAITGTITINGAETDVSGSGSLSSSAITNVTVQKKN